MHNALIREEPAPYFESDEDHFFFGSIGTESQDGVPYWIWLVLPRIFPEYLPGPGGYAAVGLASKDGHELPIGLSRVTIGFPRVGINCAMCHTTSVRTSPDAPRMLVAGGPSNELSLQHYLRFLFACASDPRFTADVILAEIARNHRLTAFERAVYRFGVIPRTRVALLRLKDRWSWMDRNPDWGRGRIDPFNPAKFGHLRQPIDATIGTSDMMPLWSHTPQGRRPYHWDGLNTSLREVVLSSAIGDGTTPAWVDRDLTKWDSDGARERSSLRRVQDYIRQLRPPKYPFAVDTALASRGEAVYKTACAECHEPDAPRFESVIPVEDVATDRHRLDMWTKGAAAAYNEYGRGHDWKFSSFRTTTGYVAVHLDGLWLRAPYLHNGSVPTLADLLEPVDARPLRFRRGVDVYDPVKVGFVTAGPLADTVGTVYDTGLPGNSNAGHLYGTAIPTESKRALLEYLKTR